jgi:hypothetical protein
MPGVSVWAVSFSFCFCSSSVSLPDEENWVDSWGSEWLRIRLWDRRSVKLQETRDLQVLACGRLYFAVYWLLQLL